MKSEERNQLDEEEKLKRKDFNHIRFLVAFSVVYIFIKYGYPFLKNLLF